LATADSEVGEFVVGVTVGCDTVLDARGLSVSAIIALSLWSRVTTFSA
jgi:hypothetical protein